MITQTATTLSDLTDQNVICINREGENQTTPTTGFIAQTYSESQSAFPFSVFKMTQTRVTCCLLWALFGFPVPYINLIVNHQVSSFLKTFPSHFLTSCAKGFRYCWFQSFFLLGLEGTEPAPLWKEGVFPLKIYSCQTSLTYEDRTNHFPKWESFFMTVWKEKAT